MTIFARFVLLYVLHRYSTRLGPNCRHRRICHDDSLMLRHGPIGISRLLPTLVSPDQVAADNLEHFHCPIICCWRGRRRSMPSCPSLLRTIS